MINLKSLLILNIFAALVTLASIAFTYHVSDRIIESETTFDYEPSIEGIMKIDDIDFLRETIKLS